MCNNEFEIVSRWQQQIHSTRKPNCNYRKCQGERMRFHICSISFFFFFFFCIPQCIVSFTIEIVNWMHIGLDGKCSSFILCVAGDAIRHTWTFVACRTVAFQVDGRLKLDIQKNNNKLFKWILDGQLAPPALMSKSVWIFIHFAGSFSPNWRTFQVGAAF